MSSKNLSFEDYLEIGQDFEQFASSIINFYVQLPSIFRDAEDLLKVDKHISTVRSKVEARLHTDFSEKSNSQLACVFYGNKGIFTADAQYESINVVGDEVTNPNGTHKLIPRQIEDFKEMAIQVKELYEQVISLHNKLAKIFGKTAVINLMGIRNQLERTKYTIAVHVQEKFTDKNFEEFWLTF